MHTCPGCEADYSHKWETLEHEHDCPLIVFLAEDAWTQSPSRPLPDWMRKD